MEIRNIKQNDKGGTNMTQNKSKKPNAKYVVICYAIHDKAIASHDSFDSEEDAFRNLNIMKDNERFRMGWVTKIER